jgi:hypothetical protein
MPSLWDFLHADTRRRLGQRLAAPITCQDIKPEHTQKAVSAGPTAWRATGLSSGDALWPSRAPATSAQSRHSSRTTFVSPVPVDLFPPFVAFTP